MHGAYIGRGVLVQCGQLRMYTVVDKVLSESMTGECMGIYIPREGGSTTAWTIDDVCCGWQGITEVIRINDR